MKKANTIAHTNKIVIETATLKTLSPRIIERTLKISERANPRQNNAVRPRLQNLIGLSGSTKFRR
jgi:hypothetical protein